MVGGGICYFVFIKKLFYGWFVIYGFIICFCRKYNGGDWVVRCWVLVKVGFNYIFILRGKYFLMEGGNIVYFRVFYCFVIVIYF